MSTIYIILGIVGWTVTPIVLSLYVIAGMRQRVRGIDVNKDEHVEIL